jgi:hypothetical protein
MPKVVFDDMITDSVEGRPYFSFYDLTKLLESFGSVEATRTAMDKFRAKAVAAGLPGLHLNAVVWGQPILPREKKAVESWQKSGEGRLAHQALPVDSRSCCKRCRGSLAVVPKTR